MSNTITIIQGTGVICKGNVKGNYEQVPMELFDYIELELITHTDMVVYVKLLQRYNTDHGYAYPTIPRLMVQTCIGSKATIHNSLNTLEEVGLIKKGKASRGNNIYFVYKPLDKAELYRLVPDKVEQLKEFESKQMKTAEHDKERYQQHQQKEQQQQPEIQAKQIAPKVSTESKESTEIENNDLLSEEIRMMERMKLLS